MNNRLTEILDSIDFYGSTLSKTAWYVPPTQKGKNAKDGKAGRRNRKKEKIDR